MDQGGDVAAELSESDSLSTVFPAPVTVCLNLVWRYMMQKQNDLSTVSELQCILYCNNSASAPVARRHT